MKTRRLQGKTEGANGGSVQRLVRRGRGDIRALNLCVDALDGCTSIRMVKATLDFMTDRYLTHPSPQLPEHLRRETPNDKSSATRRTGRTDYNQGAMAGFAAAHR